MKLTFERKIEEYQNWVLTHGKTPPKKAKIKFSDESDMRSWGHNWRRYVRDFIKEHPQEILPEKLQKIEEMCQNIENESEGKIQLAAKKEEMSSRIEQYIEKTRELGRRPTEKDKAYFRDGKDMVEWYYDSNNRYGKTENNSKDKVSQPLNPFQEMKRQLYQEGYYKGQLWKIEPLTYQEKTEEYLSYVIKNKRVPELEDTFSDGGKMANWYHNQLVVIHSEQRTKKTLSKSRMKEIELFAWMENEILKVKDIPIIRKPRMTTEEKRKYFITYIDKKAFCSNKSSFFFPDETSVNNWFFTHKDEVSQYLPEHIKLTFEERILEYLEMVKENQKKLNTRDPRLFSDQTSAAIWIMKQENRTRKECSQNASVSNLRMSELYISALLDDYIYTLNHQKRSMPENKTPLDTTPWVKRIKSSVH